LILTGDLSEHDLTTSGHLAAALAELLPDMVKRCAGEPGGSSQRAGDTL
jgi:hypothetical protein